MRLAHEEGLRLIAGMMPQCKVENTMSGAGLGEDLITGRPRGLLQSSRAIERLNAQNAHGDIERLKPGRCQRSLGRGAFPQTMIDDKGPDSTAPSSKQPGKTETICPTRDRNAYWKPGVVGWKSPKALHESRKLPRRDRACTRSGAPARSFILRHQPGQWQLARPLKLVTAAFTRGVGEGNSESSFCRA